MGEFDVQWLHLTHSTPETCALHIQVGGHSVLHTADWKSDSRPVVGPAWTPSTWKNLLSSGVDAVVCDSTNALKPGRSATEGEVAEGLLTTIAPLSGKVVVACFASNIARMQSILRLAHACDRRVGLLGRSLENMYRNALANRLLEPEFRPIDARHLEYLPAYEVLALATGSQGEPGSALHQLGRGTHRHLSVGEGDTVIFSAKTIPGNEEAVARSIALLRDRGVNVIHADESEHVLHASGHPCQNDLADLYRVLQPKLVIPVHGELEHMKANARVARSTGVQQALTGQNGDLFYLAPVPGVRKRWTSVGRLEWLENEERLQTAGEI
jgi:ribonuclease J